MTVTIVILALTAGLIGSRLLATKTTETAGWILLATACALLAIIWPPQ